MGNKQTNQQSYKRRAFTTITDESFNASNRLDSYSNQQRSTIRRKMTVLLLGSDQTGKTNLLKSLKKEKFSTFYSRTIGVSFVSHRVDIDDKTINAQLFDTPGHKRYKELIVPYYRDAMGVCIMFNVTSEKSFLEVPDLLKEVRNRCVPNVPVLLVGNKCDEPTRDVQYKRAKAFADDSSLPYLEVSCKDGTNVEYALVSLLTLINKRTRDVHAQSVSDIL